MRRVRVLRWPKFRTVGYLCRVGAFARELEVLGLGLPTQRRPGACTREKAVETHIRYILTKPGCVNRVQAAVLVLQGRPAIQLLIIAGRGPRLVFRCAASRW